MTGYEQFNIPAFDLATGLLRKAGLDVTSPAELDSPEVRAAAMASADGDQKDVDRIETWGDMLARDVKMITDELDALIMLNGWQRSSGAKLEAYVGILGKKDFYLYQGNGQVIRVSRKYIAEILSNALTSD